MTRQPNSTVQTEVLLVALLGSRPEWRYGYDLSRETKLKSGTLYPILMRLEKQGWLEARWEDEPALGKPRRHLYRLTANGVAEATSVLNAARHDRRAAPSRRVGEGLAR